MISGGVSKKGTDIGFIKKGFLQDQSKFIYQRAFYQIVIVLMFIFVLSLLVYNFIIKKYLLENIVFKRKRKIQKILKKLNDIKDHGEIFHK